MELDSVDELLTTTRSVRKRLDFTRPVAYFTGETFRPAKRLPATQLTYWNAWGATR